MNGPEERPGMYPVMITGLVAGIRSVIAVISFASLIFVGRLAPFLSSGIDIALFSAFILGAAVALASSYKGAIAIPQDKTAAIFAVMMAGVAASLPASIPPDDLFRTVTAGFVTTSLLTGLLLLLMGIFRMGVIIRFIPYPVIGGIIAATGWLLVRGSFSVMLGDSLGLEDLFHVLVPSNLVRWAPGVALALLLFITAKKIKHFLVMPTLLVGSIWIFYGAVLLAGKNLHQASEMGLMLGPFPPGERQLAALTLTGTIQWDALYAAFPNMLTIALLSVIALLLYASGIELAVEKDIDLDRELRAAGIGNLLSSLGGGMVGFHALSLTILTHHMKAASRMTGLISAGICGMALLIGADALSYIPRAIMGGLLLFLGLDFLYQWIVVGYRRLPRIEYSMIWLILIVVVGVGFLEGVAAGVFAGLLISVYNYSQGGVIQYDTTGVHAQSNVERSVGQRKILKERGMELYAVKLRGFIFFGTADGLLRVLRNRADDELMPLLRYVLFDFRLVTGIDSSAVMGFVRLKQLAETRGFVICLAGVPLQIALQLKYGGFDFEGSHNAFLFEDMDYALEYCEDRILENSAPSSPEPAEDWNALLESHFPREVSVKKFFTYCSRFSYDAGEYLMLQGEDAGDLFFIVSGRVKAMRTIGGGKTIRLRSMGPGTVVGEIGLFLGVPRTATVVTETPVTVFRLTRRNLERMQREAPRVAAAFHLYLVRLLSERLAGSNRALEAVID